MVPQNDDNCVVYNENSSEIKALYFEYYTKIKTKTNHIVK